MKNKAKKTVLTDLFLDPSFGGFVECLDESAARNWVLKMLYPRGPRCPFCDTGLMPSDSWQQNRVVACPSCRRRFRGTAGTIAEGIHVPFKVFALALVLIILDIHPRIVADLCGISVDTARLWGKKVQDKGGQF